MAHSKDDSQVSCIMLLAADMDFERIPSPCYTLERPRYRMRSRVVERLLSVAILCKVVVQVDSPSFRAKHA